MEEAVLLERIKISTHFSRKRLDAMIVAAEAAYTDVDRARREKQQYCRWCYYGRSPRIAGQAFTERACYACTTVVTYPTTDTNLLCVPCAQRYGACVSCCADIDLINRVKLERHSKKNKKGRQP
jgi:hypothetical protein